MELRKLDRAVNLLQNVISQFPVGVSSLDDFKPIEDKIADIRVSLRAIQARKLTLKAFIDTAITANEPTNVEDLRESLEELNESTTNYLINTKALSLCYHSRALQNLVLNDAGTPELQERARAGLNRLLTLNDKMATKNEKRKELMKKQYQLKVECHNAIYNHQEFLKEAEERRNQRLQELHPTIVQNKKKINETLFKINTMKKLITNLCAVMPEKVFEFEELIKMLTDHKDTVSIENIVELTQNRSSVESDS